MRYLKWISVLTILAMLFAMLPATVAEDGIVVDLEESVDMEMELEGELLKGFDVSDDLALSLYDANLELDGLEESFTTSEAEKHTEAALTANVSGDFEIDEEGTLTRYRGFDKNVVIPDGVKAIGEEAFENDTLIESVSIPNSVTYIGCEAFSDCTGLKNITIPDSVIETDSGVFYGCTSLTSIQLSNMLTTLASSFFSHCDSLETITLPNSLKSIGSYAFSSCIKLKNISIPTSVAEIHKGAFENCDSLEIVTLPGGIVDIGDIAFANCDRLQSITIPASVTSIDRSAFNDSTNVTIRGTAGTYAERFANGVGIPFNAPVVTFDENTLTDWDDSPYIIQYINQTRTLNAVQKPADLARELTWSSSDANVVAVDQNGTIQGIVQGTATITAATADGKGKAAQLKVLVPEPTEISVSAYDNEIILGQTMDIEAYTDIPYQYDTKVEMPVTWSSSNSSIISIETASGTSVTLKGNKPIFLVFTSVLPDPFS